MARALIAAAIVLGLAASAAAAETPIPPAPTRWVTDPSGFLSPAARQQLDTRLEHYQQATGHQVIVWIGTTLGGAPLEEWVAKAFSAWGIGRRGKDDGVGIFVFPQDRRMRIEVGYGVEDRLPDAYASRIVREVMQPALEADDHDGALRGAVDQVLSRIGDEPGGVAVPALAPKRARSPATTIVEALALVALLILGLTHPRLAMLLLWNILGRGGGGGFGGGGGGGDFGGGGGRSGGGGASGSW